MGQDCNFKGGMSLHEQVSIRNKAILKDNRHQDKLAYHYPQQKFLLGALVARGNESSWQILHSGLEMTMRNLWKTSSIREIYICVEWLMFSARVKGEKCCLTQNRISLTYLNLGVGCNHILPYLSMGLSTLLLPSISSCRERSNISCISILAIL